MLYNLDTSIWIDYYEKRNGIGEYAKKLIKKIISENSIIIYSDIHIAELRGQGYSIDQINSMLSIAKPNNIKRMHASDKQLIEAENISSKRRIPKTDVLFSILARDNFAIMVTRDNHFKQIAYISNPKRPEELL